MTQPSTQSLDALKEAIVAAALQWASANTAFGPQQRDWPERAKASCVKLYQAVTQYEIAESSNGRKADFEPASPPASAAGEHEVRALIWEAICLYDGKEPFNTEGSHPFMDRMMSKLRPYLRTPERSDVINRIIDRLEDGLRTDSSTRNKLQRAAVLGFDVGIRSALAVIHEEINNTAGQP